MLHHPRTALLSVALFGFLSLPSLLAQEIPLDDLTLRKIRESHGEGLGLPIADAEQMQRMLAQRLRRAQDLGGLQKLIQDAVKNPEKYGFNPEQRRLLEKAARDGFSGVRPEMFDERLQNLVKDILDEQGKNPNPEMKISPEQIEEWKKLLPQPDKQPVVGPQPVGPMRPAVRPDVPPERPNGNVERPAPRPAPPAMPPPRQQPRPPKTGFQKWLAEHSNEMAKWMKNRNWGQNSPAMQKAIRDLSRSLMARESGAWPQVKGLSDRLPRLEGLLPKNLDGRSWFPDLSKFTPRNPGIPTPNVGKPELPRTSGWGSLLWVAMAVCFAVVAWRLLAWRQSATAAQPEWRPGPWPVPPEAVRTREDLVKAFEHLALLLLGRRAFPLHHVAIGAWMAGDPRQATPERQRAVWNLAGLYEQARYAPPEQPLPPADIDMARDDLRLLAGVHA